MSDRELRHWVACHLADLLTVLLLVGLLVIAVWPWIR